MISTRLRVVAVFLVFFAFALVLSTPTPIDVELAKRSSGDDVLAILTTVKQATDTILPQINALVAGGQISDATLRPLLANLASTAVTAIKGLSTLQRPITFNSGASQADIVTLAIQICSNLASSAVGVILVIPNLLATAVFVVTSVLQGLTGLAITLPGLPPITLFR